MPKYFRDLCSHVPVTYMDAEGMFCVEVKLHYEGTVTSQQIGCPETHLQKQVRPLWHSYTLWMRTSLLSFWVKPEYEKDLGVDWLYYRLDLKMVAINTCFVPNTVCINCCFYVKHNSELKAICVSLLTLQVPFGGCQRLHIENLLNCIEIGYFLVSRL